MANRAKRALVHILAWAFIICSLWPLVGDLRWPPQFPAGDQENTYILRAVVGGREYTSWGLTYVGQTGHRLRLAEIAGVALAAVLSALPQNGLRRLGLLALVAWAGMWMGNAVRMAFIAPVWIFVAPAMLMTVFFLVTVMRARLSWRTRGRPGRAGDSGAHALKRHSVSGLP